VDLNEACKLQEFNHFFMTGVRSTKDEKLISDLQQKARGGPHNGGVKNFTTVFYG
jgi:hypothetical protein